MNRIVLIVEDTDACRDTLEVALMKLPDLGVRSVRTAEEALQCMAGNEICALVTDLHLPRMDGYQLIQAVRSQPGRVSLPILVVSGDSDPLVASRLAGLGANAYFPKPFSPAAVRNKLEQLLSASTVY
jgi:two-component system, chemotaxis family, chemotaxis protein CheY